MHVKRWMIFFVIYAILGSAPTYSSQDKYRKIKKNQALINDVYRYIVANYVDEIDLDAFTKMSIDNMLMDLDPYTVFLEREEKSGIEMLTKGKYGGVGIQIGKRDNRLTVLSPMENSPAKRAGIISGDRIIEIDGKETYEMNMEDAAKLIRGPKGTVITLTIQRSGISDLQDYSLIREDIKLNDVFYTGMLDESTGYIRLTRFSKNSSKEIEKSISELIRKNMTGMILDLRDNPGGLLSAAIDILDLFIDKNQVLVWTDGKTKRANRIYKSKSDPIVPKDINLVVLINQGSASASEIVSGVLQDLDRAVVIGRPSYGKGLVQTVYKIDNDRSLKMTTAKYYIPSGRLIQKDGYLPSKILADKSNIDTSFVTSGGRSVIGGGGIVPDYHIKLEKPGPILSACYREGLFFTFVQNNKNYWDGMPTLDDKLIIIDKFEKFLKETDIDIKMEGESNYQDMKDYFNQLDSANLSINGAFELMDQYFEQIAATQFEREADLLHHRILVEFAEHYSGLEGRMKYSSMKDKDILKALSILNDPLAYKDVFLPN